MSRRDNLLMHTSHLFAYTLVPVFPRAYVDEAVTNVNEDRKVSGPGTNETYNVIQLLLPWDVTVRHRFHPSLSLLPICHIQPDHGLIGNHHIRRYKALS